MQRAIILHGKPSKDEYFSGTGPSPSNAHWLPWLQKQLLLNGVSAQTPEMPQPYQLDYEAWRQVFESYTIDNETRLVGHSAGGGFIVRWLSEHPAVVVNKVVLVAPWMDLEGTVAPDFFSFRIDPNLVARTKGVTIFHSLDDAKPIQATVERLRSTIDGVGYREFSNYGHFFYRDMGTDAFPELLDEVATNG